MLTTAGGTIGNRLTISSESDAKIIFNETGTDVKYQQIAFQDHGVEYGRLGTYGDDQLKWTGKILLHEGNIGDYALKNYNNQGAVDYNNVLYDGIQYVSGASTNTPIKYGILMSTSIGDASWQLLGGRLNEGLYFRGGSNNGTGWGDWKTIAFTDSTVTGAGAIKDDAGNSIVYLGKNGMLYIGDVIYANTSTKILGKNIYLAYGASATNGLILNSSGNVTIGVSDLAGTESKLSVDGGVTIKAYKGVGSVSKIADLGNAGLVVSAGGNRGNWGMGFWTESNGTGFIQQQAFGSATTYALCFNPFGGNVLIGTKNDNGSGAKLQVAGEASVSSLVVTGASTFGGQSTFNALALFNKPIVAKDTLQIGDATIMWDGNKKALIVDKSLASMGEISAGGGLSTTEDLLSYGVEWDTTQSTPDCTRIGNPLLHKSLPIQSKLRGCVANGNNINYYLYSEDWAYKEDGTTPSILDGTDGTVRVDTGAKFYIKSGSNGTKRWVRISTIQIDSS